MNRIQCHHRFISSEDLSMKARPRYKVALAGLLTAIALTACSKNERAGATADSSAAQAKVMGDSASMISQNLMKFDTLDFDVFSNQKWDRLKESHAQDITVSWPDGHDTKGIEKHIQDLKGMFVAIPDLKITEHPIRIANGHWTAVTGRMVGTFSKPMALGNGKYAQPTGKKLDLTMATIGHWTDAGVMDHEWLFWDNQTFVKQLGLAP
jgi:predicted ester cyclase